MVKDFTAKIAADNKSIGFDFQYYYFLFQLLNLKRGESIGLEVLDDVHIDLVGGKRVLIQLKHTVQNKSNGQPVNLRSTDEGFWKTLANWSQIICDLNANDAQQMAIVDNTDFILSTNKSYSNTNTIVEAFKEFKAKRKAFKDLKEEIYKYNKNESISPHISKILSLNDAVLQKFFLKIDFECDTEDIITKCKHAIGQKMISENRINDVFNDLYSQVKSDNFANIRKGLKILLSFEDFYLKYRKIFDATRNLNLPVRNVIPRLPQRLHDQIFIKQIVEIGDTTPDDHEALIEFTRFKLKMETNLQLWFQNGELTKVEIEEFEKEAQLIWKNLYKEKYRGVVLESQINMRAQSIIDELRKARLKIDNQELDVEMSNGEYYALSDVPKIGWRNDWDKKYKI